MGAIEVAGWFVGPFMSKIIEACSDYLKEQVGWQTGMKKELESLRLNHPRIQAVVFAAKQAQISDQNPALNEWIWQLRDALDEVNDVLDELDYMKHKEQLTKNMEETKLIKNKKLRKLRSMKKRLFKIPRKILKIGERALKRDPILKRLEEAVQKLDKVSANVTTFLHLLDKAKKQQKEKEVDFYKTRETGSLPTTNDLIGRGEAKEDVTQWLKKLSNEHRDRNISLLSIVGHGGMGKTTLLQHVYKDEITKEFDLKMWVCVSNNFDVKKVIVDMLECLEVKKRPRLDDTLNALQNSLMTEIMSKKFLLILDDIWEEEEENLDISKWEKVLAPLAYGKIGSGILLTTRMDSVATMLAKVIKTKKETFKLESLKEDECLQLLNSHAFAGVENPPDDHKKLKSIAGEIVKKLSGSPLAAKVIGGLLNSLDLDERRWRTVLESNLLGENSVDSILRLSYIVLSNPLKSCFAFCCGMFVQDHAYDKDDLIRMWIALGFIQPSRGMTMEDIGESYFDVLVKKTLLEKVGDDYKMHDLIHESASKFFAHECGKFVGDEESSLEISETVRHLYVLNAKSDISRKIEKFKHVRSLFLFYDDFNQDNCSALTEIFKALRSLRLLYIWAPRDLKLIPEEIGNLIHLRYLRIEGYNLTMLPRSVSNLYHLQYIIYDEWVSSKSKVDDFLPSDFNNLSKLRHVKLPEKYISSICGIGKLKSLLEMNMFDLRDVSGYKIGELENMNDLYILGINCLENVKDAEEAFCAKLFVKKRLTNLTFCWSNTCSADNIDFDDSDDLDENDFDVLHENVLDNLRPPECLMNLSINNYRGARSPIWMNKINPISKLEKIELSDCRQWETLPPFGKLCFLKSLKLFGMLKVKWLESKFNGNDKYDAFPLLEVLHISGFEALEDWFEAGVAAEDGCLFPSLIELRLHKCPKLKELPSLPPKLKKLQIRSTGWKTLKFCSNSNPIPLEKLEVLHCRNITSLPLADEIARLAALRYLTIGDCPNLSTLGSHREVGTTNNCHLILNFLCISDPSVLLMEPLTSIASLKELSIWWNDKLVSFPNEAEQWFLNVSSSLCELHFMYLKSLESLPCSLESLSSLQKLSIIQCSNLISLARYREVETTNNCQLMLNTLKISDPSVLLMEPLRSIASLKTLSIWGNDKLVSFPNEAEQWFLEDRSSLCELHFMYLKSLESLPSSLESLSSLHKLYIEDVPMLRELPNLPPSLKQLRFFGEYHPELKERYREDGGSDGHKIAHIPDIYFDK
ncbi:hypothetical protein M5K25_009769 [Dendrobium thyrsiflorum]|uniref:Disease resistance protein n=1 Tax=Dendrobium thyrsiflorum TaxID=117978 RepID=A0ABD0VDF1_DENTH